MHVFLTGATGYLGSAALEKLTAAGHRVTGLVRTEEAAARVRAAGAEPVMGDLRETAALADFARGAEGVLHAGLAWGKDAGAIDRAAVEAMLDALAGSGKPFLYTSGAWVMGDTRGRLAGEMFALKPPAMVAWRPAVERLVLDATERRIRGIVLRPAMVYGRDGHLGARFRSGKLRWIGTGDNHWSFVHVDDLADLYVLALENSAAGELYIVSHGPTRPVKEVAAAVGITSGIPIEEARALLGPMADVLTLDIRAGSTKAARLLGWRPARPSVIEELKKGTG